MSQEDVIKILKKIYPLWIDSTSLAVNMDITRASAVKNLRSLIKGGIVISKKLDTKSYYNNQIPFYRLKNRR